MIVTLKDDLKYKHGGGSLLVYLPTVGTYRFDNISDEDLKLFFGLKIGIELVNPTKFVQTLCKLGVIKERVAQKDALTNRTRSWIANFGLDGITKYESARQKSVLILGCGGVGSIVIQQLLQLGFRSLSVVDDANVNISDLNRQGIYSKEDVGRRKVDCCASYACEEFDISHFRTFYEHIKTPENLNRIIRNVDPILTFCCIDKPVSHYKSLVTRAVLGEATGVIFCEVGVFEAFIGPLLVTDLDKDSYLKSKVRDLKNFDGVTTSNSSICFSNCLSASFMTQLGFNYLCDIDCCDGSSLYRYDFRNLEVLRLEHGFD